MNVAVVVIVVHVDLAVVGVVVGVAPMFGSQCSPPPVPI